MLAPLVRSLGQHERRTKVDKVKGYLLAATGFAILVGALVIGVADDAAAPPPPQPILTSEVVKDPIQKLLCIALGTAPLSCGAFPSSFSVPSDQRLVIEFVSGTCEVTSPTTRVNVALETTVGADTRTHVLHLLADPLQTLNFDFTYQTRVYADPGSNVSIFSSVGGAEDFGSTCFLAFSGRLTST